MLTFNPEEKFTVDWRDGVQLYFKRMDFEEENKAKNELVEKGFKDNFLVLKMAEATLIGWNDELKGTDGEKLEFNDKTKAAVFKIFYKEETPDESGFFAKLFALVDTHPDFKGKEKEKKEFVSQLLQHQETLSINPENDNMEKWRRGMNASPLDLPKNGTS